MSDESLASCLDSCPPRVTAETTVQNCRTVKNLFNGSTAVNCVNVDHFPTALDYRPAGYAGAAETKTLTRFVQVPANDPDAVAVTANGSVPIWGADYGGNTPLYDTINLMLASPSVAADMTAHKNMAVIVMTDGVDTNTGSTDPNDVKSLCGSVSPLTAKLAAINPNAKPLFVSFDDQSPAIMECSQSALWVSDNSLGLTASQVNPIMSGNPVDYSDPIESQNFCNSFFGTGTIYTDANIPTTNVTLSPGVCRPYEVDP